MFFFLQKVLLQEVLSASHGDNQNEYAIIGASIERFPPSQLPTWGQVFARIFHLKERYPRNTNTADVVGEVVAEIYDLWQKANIPTITSNNAVVKITKAFSNYQTVTSKHAGRESLIQNEQIGGITEMCQTLCDVATPNVVQQIRSNRLLSSADKDVSFYSDH